MPPAPKPEKSMENFFGKNIVAILAGLLIISATIALIFMSWNAVPNSVRFAMLTALGGIMLAASLIHHPKMPEFLRYAVIKNLFATAGLSVLFITFLLGHVQLQLYPLFIASILLALWGCGALLIAQLFRLITATVVGAIGMVVGCYVTSIMEQLGQPPSSPLFMLLAAGFGCVYLVASLFAHRHISKKPYMYVLLSVAAMLILALPFSVFPDDLGIYHAILAALTVATVASMAYAAREAVITTNIVYVLSIAIYSYTFISGGELTGAVYAGCITAAALLCVSLRAGCAPAAIGALLFAYIDTSFPHVGGYPIALAALSLIALYYGIASGNAMRGNFAGGNSVGGNSVGGNSVGGNAVGVGALGGIDSGGSAAAGIDGTPLSGASSAARLPLQRS
jgi:hypothetical protein